VYVARQRCEAHLKRNGCWFVHNIVLRRLILHRPCWMERACAALFGSMWLGQDSLALGRAYSYYDSSSVAIGERVK
jgi:hypothetical protein